MRARSGSKVLNDNRREVLRAAAISIAAAGFTFALLFIASGSTAISAQDKYMVSVPQGLSFSEFRGYEDWQTIGVSQTDDTIEVILGNPAMIEAYKSGAPANGKPFPDGARMAKIHWTKKAS